MKMKLKKMKNIENWYNFSVSIMWLYKKLGFPHTPVEMQT